MAIRSKIKPNAEFNFASMSDIVFLLLIYFMLTSSFVIDRSLEVDLPSSKSNMPHSGNNTVTITSDLIFAWNQSTTAREDIPGYIQSVLTDDNEDNNVITLKVDKTVIMEEVAYVMSAVAEHGGKIVILTRKK